MARQLRIEYEGAFYHVTSRGNQRGKIFWDDKDRKKLKAILERTKERYLLELGRYIHLNPVRAKVVRRPEEFRWSSYRDYISTRKDGAVVDTDETLGFFSKRRGVAIKRYLEFVSEGIHGRSPLESAAGSILGDEQFRERVVKYLRSVPDKAAIPEIRKIRKKQEIDEVVKVVAKYYGLPEVDLIRWRRRTETQRKIAVYLSKILSGEKNVKVGTVFGITIQAVTNTVRRVEKRIEEDTRFSSEIMSLKEIVTTVK